MKLIEQNFTPTSLFLSSLSNLNSNCLRQLRPEYVRPHLPWAMRRVPAKIIPNFQSPRIYPNSIMASEGTREMQSSVDSKEKGTEKKEKKEKNVKLPPPPEKPLPGDCCGSGCVRCVWDIYYEELEDYNKLCEKVGEELSGRLRYVREKQKDGVDPLKRPSRPNGPHNTYMKIWGWKDCV
ncbi:uncharacterized protein LOC120072947 [Benincasa hispida]|uniref:uncharacterized protein LOC120072947 n=1 Tax=Benincasa hispida TaxID=102211 RepID=UPI001901AC99|nr:uncharacterized protein LOC120072947 [Benincasa hispida]